MCTQLLWQNQPILSPLRVFFVDSGEFSEVCIKSF